MFEIATTLIPKAAQPSPPSFLHELLGASESTAARLMEYEVGGQSATLDLFGSTAATAAQTAPSRSGKTLLVPAPAPTPATIHQQQAYDRRAAFKVATSLYAMHLDNAWRAGLFTSLDRLIDAEEWDFSDEMPTDASWRTFLRMVINLGQIRRPALAATADGKIVAAWLNGKDRLTVECGDNDDVRWSLVRWNPDREAAAGINKAGRLPQVLEAYDPGKWFALAVD